MRLGEQEYRMAKELAKEADCSVNEIVEMAVRITYVTFMLRHNGAEQLGDMAREARIVKALQPPPSVPKPHQRPSKSKTLTHSPFASLGKDSK